MVTALALVAITGNAIFDPIMALALAVYLLWTAAQVFIDGADRDHGRAPARARGAAHRGVPARAYDGGVRGYHGLRTRKAGRQRYIDIHMLVDPQQTGRGGAHDLRRAGGGDRARLPGAVVTIHLEPDDGRYRGPCTTSGRDGSVRTSRWETRRRNVTSALSFNRTTTTFSSVKNSALREWSMKCISSSRAAFTSGEPTALMNAS